MDQHNGSQLVDCAIDPGRGKIGAAFGGHDLVFSALVPKEWWDCLFSVLMGGDVGCLSSFVVEGQAPLGFRFTGMVFLGDGTGSKEVAMELSRRGIGFTLVPEEGSTLEARGLYFLLHPPRGLMRLVPPGLRVPPRDVDDLAAWAILRRSRFVAPL